MKLDRNITNPRRGKYALINLRIGNPVKDTPSGDWHVPAKAVDFGITADTDFFVIRLKDKYAAPALSAYAGAAMRDDPEYAMEVLNLAKMAAENPFQKSPD